METKFTVLRCVLHEGAGQLEVFIKIKEVELHITYFLFDDVDDWASTYAYDPHDLQRDDLISLEEIHLVLDSSAVKPYKLQLEDYKRNKHGYYGYEN